MFTQHKLKVYQQALAQAASAEALSASWGRRHAIVEHYRRASESIVLNIAEGARLLSGADKARTLDYAIGSTLECAGCLDIASIKGRLSAERSLMEKRRFLEITRMLIGLRKAWLQSVMSELDHRRFLEIAAASVVKTEAYLEIYQQKALPTSVETSAGRELLGRILAMLSKF